MDEKLYDFSGWATKNNYKCSDGRTIRRDAFIENDGKTVPLVFNHLHDSPYNILGHALLENRPEGVYIYGKFNNTEAGQTAKELVRNKDISALSIYANHLKQTKTGDVLHGKINEVSLVFSSANPGGTNIDNVVIAHGDGEHVIHVDPLYYEDEEVEDAGFFYLEHSDDVSLSLFHAELTDDNKTEEKKEAMAEESNNKTVKDVYDSMTEEQKTVVQALVGAAIEEAKNEDDEDEEEVEHSYSEENSTVKFNVFDNDNNNSNMNVLSHSDITAIINDAKKYGSLKDSFLAHSDGDVEGPVEFPTDPSYLFPDAKNLTNTPQFISRDMAWVSEVMSGTTHSPFSRVKSLFADITEDEARARGYIKGRQKKNEVFTLLKRTTDPQTIYKKQKMDRDDIIDITDFDVVAWIKSEMRVMLNEEIARAVLVGDGRETSDEDYISHDHIRPIWTDADLFTIKKIVTSGSTDDETAKNFIRTAIKARKDYKGSGSPVLFTTEDMLTNMLLVTDEMGRDLYDSVDKLATKLRVSRIVSVPVMENLTRTDGAATKTLLGIIVNLKDYNIGADKGGAVSLFDDFDIDYNAYKYLIETRCSGALTRPYSAIALEISSTGSDEDE